MRLFILSLLAIGSVHSLTIGYPYRSGLVGYNPARGEFPVQSAVVQGYLRYLDSHGVERLVGYSYPEPVYGVRQVSYVGGAPAVSSPAIRAYSQEESSEFMRAREAHFRAWSLQQYQALKLEIDALRAEGKEPSADMLAKFQPLERIALTSNYTSIAELPDVGRIRDEHLSIWNEARIQSLQSETGQQPIGEIKTYAGNNAPLVPVEETLEQKLARQEHLRIYNEQLSRLRQLQEQREHNIQAVVPTTQTQIAEQPLNRLASQSGGITEVERATQEHLRLWNEAKLRAEQASYQQHGVTTQSGGKAYGAAADKQVISELKQDQTIPQTQQFVQESTELQKAREEHLRLMNEAKAKIQSAEGRAGANVPQVNTAVPFVQPQLSQLRFPVPVVQPQVQQPQHVVVDTPEVVRAREEHLRLVNEARLRAQSVEQDELKHKHVVQVPLLKAAIHQPQPIQFQGFQAALPQVSQPASVADTPEVIKAREDHLRLVNEAKLHIQSVEQQQRTLEQRADFQPGLPVQYQPNVLPQIADSPEVIKAREEHLRLVNEANLKVHSQLSTLDQQADFKSVLPLQHQLNVQPQIADTPEVIKAREEHLRLGNDAKLKVQSVEQQRLALDQQVDFKSVLPVQHQLNVQPQISDTPEVIKAREEHLRLVNDAKLKVQSVEQQLRFKSVLPAQHQLNVQPQIADTAEVVKAREEHLRLVNEAKLKAQSVEHRPETGLPLQHQQNIQPRLEETPEVQQARQEHLRIFNEVKAHAEKEQSKLSEIKSSRISFRSQQSTEEAEKIRQDERQKEELRLLELQRLREVERLQEDQKQLELERIREAERLAEEQRQMESELMRLKLEEEQRLELETLLESRRLKAEQEQLQQIIITEEYKPTPNQGTFILDGQQQQQQYVDNPFLRSIAADGQVVQQQIQPVALQQQEQQLQLEQQQEQYIKSTQPTAYYPVSQPEKSSQTLLPGVRYIQSPQQSIGSKHQHLKDDSIKIPSADHASYQPADTAAALIHLEKARQEHFRAHEQALEQLRLARVQNPSLKDCNH